MSICPLFTIIIPTYKRPDFVISALKSVLYQDYSDYNILVSNNGACKNTKENLLPYLNDKRIHYLETEQQLSMPQHWDFITRNIVGQYFLILTDRCVLKQGALSFLSNYISKKPQDIISWPWDIYVDETKVLIPPFKVSDNILTIDSEEYLDKFLKTHIGVDFPMPRALNSCVRVDFLCKLLSKYEKLFIPLSPDVTFSLFCFMNSNSISYIENSLMVSYGLNTSNGGSVYELNASHYLNTLGELDIFSSVPCKLPFLVNSVAQDFFSVAKICHRDDLAKKYSWTNYYIQMYNELDAKIVAKKLPENEINRYKEEIDSSLLRQNKSIRNEVLYRRRYSFILILNKLIRRKIINIVHSIFSGGLIYIYRALKVRLNKKITCQTVFEAAGFNIDNI